MPVGSGSEHGSVACLGLAKTMAAGLVIREHGVRPSPGSCGLDGRRLPTGTVAVPTAVTLLGASSDGRK